MRKIKKYASEYIWTMLLDIEEYQNTLLEILENRQMIIQKEKVANI